MRIRSLRLPEVREVGDGFAPDCVSLVSLELPELKEAGDCFTYNCPSLPKEAIPSCVSER